MGKNDVFYIQNLCEGEKLPINFNLLKMFDKKNNPFIKTKKY